MSTYTILLFIVASATFIYFPEKQKEQVTEALEVKAKSTVQMLAIGISLALDVGDYDLILEVFNLTQADTNIAYIAVLDEIGDEIISFNPIEIQTPNIIRYSPKKVFEEQEIIFVTKRLLIEDKIYGNLVIGYSLKGRNETITRIRWTGFWLSLTIFLLGTLISVYISRQITNPLQNVVETFKEMGRAGTYDKMIEKSSTDEIGSLIDGFNDMSANIHTRTEELRDEIIEHKKAAEALRDSEERVRSLIQQSVEAIYMFDPLTMRVLEGNPAFLDYLGYRTDDVHTLTIYDIIAHDKKSIDDYVQKILKHGVQSYIIGDRLWWRKDGTLIDVQVSAGKIQQKGKDIIFVVARDITEQKKAEEERIELEKKLERAKRMEALGILAGGVAHDLNNTLVPILGLPDLILSNLSDEDSVSKQVQLIKKSAERAADIIDDLLTLARRGRYEMTPLSLNGVVNSYVGSPLFEETKRRYPDVVFESTLDGDCLNVFGSAPHITKLLLNLTNNAFEAMPHGGTLRVSTINKYVDLLPENWTIYNASFLINLHNEGGTVRCDKADLHRSRS